MTEYIKTSTITSGYPMLITASYIGMKDMATEDIFQWVTSKPKIVTASTIIFSSLNAPLPSIIELRPAVVAQRLSLSGSHRFFLHSSLSASSRMEPLTQAILNWIASHLSITQELKIPVSIGLFSIGGHVEKEVEIKEIRSATVLGFEDPTQDMMIL
ncbi:hypothetical protein HN873_064804 [Arachis hypogaea]